MAKSREVTGKSGSENVFSKVFFSAHCIYLPAVSVILCFPAVATH